MAVRLSEYPLPWAQFMAEQRLPARYRETAEHWFAPLVERVIAQRAAQSAPVLVGINGCQGSGKSTLAAFLEMALPQVSGLRVCVLSIDDFYRTRAERQRLAEEIHPLLATRGVPGTHDVELLAAVLDGLVQPGPPLAVPRFDKGTDDRCPRAEWSLAEVPMDVIVWEGWCVGIPPEPEASLQLPINALEREEDADGRWRRGVNAILAREYQPLFARVDLWAMLAAPGFDCVFRWRCEQEAKLRAQRSAQGAGLMTDAQIARFIQFYQRLTEHALRTLPSQVDFHYALDEQRSISSLQINNGAGCQ